MPSDICCLGARAGCDRLFLPIHMIVLHPMQNGERNDNIREKVPSKFDETEERERERERVKWQVQCHSCIRYQSIMMMKTNAKLIHPISIEPFNIYGWSPSANGSVKFFRFRVMQRNSYPTRQKAPTGV